MEAGRAGSVPAGASRRSADRVRFRRLFAMEGSRRFQAPAIARVAALAALLGLGLAADEARADTVVLKNGTVLKGAVDRDNTLIYVSDNLKRVIFYNSKVARIDSDSGFSANER